MLTLFINIGNSLEIYKIKVTKIVNYYYRE